MKPVVGSKSLKKDLKIVLGFNSGKEINLLTVYKELFSMLPIIVG